MANGQWEHLLGGGAEYFRAWRCLRITKRHRVYSKQTREPLGKCSPGTRNKNNFEKPNKRNFISPAALSRQKCPFLTARFWAARWFQDPGVDEGAVLGWCSCHAGRMLTQRPITGSRLWVQLASPSPCGCLCSAVTCNTYVCNPVLLHPQAEPNSESSSASSHGNGHRSALRCF